MKTERDEALVALSAWLDRLRLPAEWPEHTEARAEELMEHLDLAGLEVRRKLDGR